MVWYANKSTLADHLFPYSNLDIAARPHIWRARNWYLLIIIPRPGALTLALNASMQIISTILTLNNNIKMILIIAWLQNNMVFHCRSDGLQNLQVTSVQIFRQRVGHLCLASNLHLSSDNSLHLCGWCIGTERLKRQLTVTSVCLPPGSDVTASFVRYWVNYCALLVKALRCIQR